MKGITHLIYNPETGILQAHVFRHEENVWVIQHAQKSISIQLFKRVVVDGVETFQLVPKPEAAQEFSREYRQLHQLIAA